MKSGPASDRVRCAIYTRVSTDQGLDQDFNSLDAQYDAASAYIKSQAHAGWTLLRSRYDDGGYSGGSTERPALQRLLEDIRARKIDVIVVYKVDRLTRSLADFAKLVELFDGHGVSFVSVTQQFNTTTSMGRLTLNVLLSFAQFEREVTSERIRDKIAASKRKGLWVGGPLPLGYELKNGKLRIVEKEAERVRLIFRRYLDVTGINELVRDLQTKNVLTKPRTFSTGKTRGGIPFGRGTLSHLLRNRFFIGEVKYKGEILPGEQPAIIDKALFEAVQRKLSDHQSHQTLSRHKSEHLLRDLLFDDIGHIMTATHATKAGVRYRYYVSQPGLHGEARTAQLGSVSRVPAAEIEKAIVSALQSHIADENRRSAEHDNPIKFDHDGISSIVTRIEVQRTQLIISLRPAGQSTDASSLSVSWQKPPSKRSRKILLPHGAVRESTRPERAERRARLIRAIASGRKWLDEIMTGAIKDIHEAGHVVINSVLGVRTTNVLIDPITRGGKLFWIGYTDAPKLAFLDSPASPVGFNQILARSRISYAGLAAELLFAGDDRREGSSVDEIVMSQLLTEHAASPVGASPPDLWRDDVAAWCVEHLQRNRKPHAEITDALMKRGRLKGKVLRELCARVAPLDDLQGTQLRKAIEDAA